MYIFLIHFTLFYAAKEPCFGMDAPVDTRLIMLSYFIQNYESNWGGDILTNF